MDALLPIPVAPRPTVGPVAPIRVIGGRAVIGCLVPHPAKYTAIGIVLADALLPIEVLIIVTVAGGGVGLLTLFGFLDPSPPVGAVVGAAVGDALLAIPVTISSAADCIVATADLVTGEGSPVESSAPRAVVRIRVRDAPLAVPVVVHATVVRTLLFVGSVWSKRPNWSYWSRGAG